MAMDCWTRMSGLCFSAAYVTLIPSACFLKRCLQDRDPRPLPPPTPPRESGHPPNVPPRPRPTRPPTPPP